VGSPARRLARIDQARHQTSTRRVVRALVIRLTGARSHGPGIQDYGATVFPVGIRLWLPGRLNAGSKLAWPGWAGQVAACDRPVEPPVPPPRPSATRSAGLTAMHPQQALAQAAGPPAGSRCASAWFSATASWMATVDNVLPPHSASWERMTTTLSSARHRERLPRGRGSGGATATSPPRQARSTVTGIRPTGSSWWPGLPRMVKRRRRGMLLFNAGGGVSENIRSIARWRERGA
jgi:hypothetical protein